MHIFHFFIPHQKNNHRAKLLHNISLFVLIVAVGLTSTLAVIIHKTHPEVLGISYQVSDVELLNLTNYERAQAGQPPLALNSQLAQAAKKKSAHMFANNYWAHFAPDGTSPWDFIRGEGYDYTYAGENLAKGFTTSYDAVKAWMKSPTHKANLLSPNYREVGFSVAEGQLQGEDTVLIVQEFGARNNPGEVQGSNNVPLPEVSQVSQKIVAVPAINLNTVAKTLTFLLLAALLVALVLDFIIIEKKKIPRSVGNNLDHVILVTIFIAFLVMARIGKII
jgi:hypothetical protein